MEHIVRPIGCSVERRETPEGVVVTTMVYQDEGGDVVRVGGFAPAQWEYYQAIVADPESAIAAALVRAEAAEARAKIVKP